ncbi:ATP-NAD kinase family protein [Cupriavidus basilensis]|uniref:ATP-NAD kinase family protein n=1 Tax=Cupriavidus basilensis TaxID=68895 RepID=A0ABT6ALQ5_9BURK|nr:ATP-NAD kinase family protein [Cupriavidus basilensis]MDF3833539.1 ATP-NAD kinase family protein [Cupriavidus basilensis]
MANFKVIASDRSAPPLLGVVVNPIAGMGGSVGLKGTDSDVILAEALRRGAHPLAGQKATNALRRAALSCPDLRILTVAGAMGEDAARNAGLTPLVLPRREAASSTGADTRAAAAAMADHGVDLLLFVGGDGTARDIIGSVGDRVPFLGVPAGVKMHSAVFGTSPANTGLLAGLYLAGDPSASLREAEVMDLDEAAIREDRVSARLFGYARSPYAHRLAQNAKAGAGPNEDVTLDAVARQVAAEMQPGRLYILGPGTTTRRVSHALGLPNTLLGVDALLDGSLVGLDLDERTLLRLMEHREAHIIVGVLGGQGSLFGRGNQQISSEVIRQVGRDRITVIASAEKLIALEGAPLRVDTGADEIDAMLTGHIRVEIGPGRSTRYRLTA